jgi:hypothetical protein
VNVTNNMSLKILAVAAVLGLVSASVLADDKAKSSATGTWSWSRKLPDGQEQEIKAELKQDGEKLTGKVISPIGEVEIKEGKIKDSELSFEVSFEMNGNEIKVKFSGKLDGDKIKGKAEINRGGEKMTRDWEPKRVKEKKKDDK